MSLFKPNYEWLSPKTPLGQKRKNKKDGKPKAMHHSVNERRLTAIEEEGMIAHSKGILRDQNPKVSNQSRLAWYKGWDMANEGANDV